jgi:hypothetical protein
MASLPRFDPLQVLRYPPQRDEDPATPPHILRRKGARTSVSIPHCEKKRNRRAALA